MPNNQNNAFSLLDLVFGRGQRQGTNDSAGFLFTDISG